MEKIVPYLIIGAVALVILIILIKNICIVQQSRAYVIERLGAFSQVWEVGIHFKLPFVERIARRVSLKEQVLDYPPQPVITKDNVTMQIDTVVYFQITDPKLYTYGVEQPMVAMETLTATTLRNIIGDLELDQTLTSRDVINTKMRAILDEATDPWGIKVTRVELKNILPPQDIQNSMEKQMKAERDRRQAILQAEGTKRSQILVAEGEKRLPVCVPHAADGPGVLAAERALHADRAVLRQRHGLDEIAVSGADPAADQLLRQGVRLLRRGAGAQEQQAQQRCGGPPHCAASAPKKRMRKLSSPLSSTPRTYCASASAACSSVSRAPRKHSRSYTTSSPRNRPGAASCARRT